MDDRDRLFRQLGAGIELLDRSVVPALDLAHEDLGEGRPVEGEVAGLDAFQVHDRDDPAHHHRELDQTGLFQVLPGERSVGGAEGHGLGLDLLDAAAGADRLIVETNASLFLIRIRPLGIDRIGEGRPRPGDLGGTGRRHGCRQHEAGGGDKAKDWFHGNTP
jgi:hypothetical protein